MFIVVIIYQSVLTLCSRLFLLHVLPKHSQIHLHQVVPFMAKNGIATGAKGQFCLQAIFLVRYTNSEWNMNCTCGVRKTNALSLSGALASIDPKLVQYYVSNVKGCALLRSTSYVNMQKSTRRADLGSHCLSDCTSPQYFKVDTVHYIFIRKTSELL